MSSMNVSISWKSSTDRRSTRAHHPDLAAVLICRGSCFAVLPTGRMLVGLRGDDVTQEIPSLS